MDAGVPYTYRFKVPKGKVRHFVTLHAAVLVRVESRKDGLANTFKLAGITWTSVAHAPSQVFITSPSFSSSEPFAS